VGVRLDTGRSFQHYSPSFPASRRSNAAGLAAGALFLFVGIRQRYSAMAFGAPSGQLCNRTEHRGGWAPPDPIPYTHGKNDHGMRGLVLAASALEWRRKILAHAASAHVDGRRGGFAVRSLDARMGEEQVPSDRGRNSVPLDVRELRSILSAMDSANPDRGRTVEG
jgi:hypothetical protein